MARGEIGGCWMEASLHLAGSKTDATLVCRHKDGTVSVKIGAGTQSISINLTPVQLGELADKLGFVCQELRTQDEEGVFENSTLSL